MAVLVFMLVLLGDGAEQVAALCLTVGGAVGFGRRMTVRVSGGCVENDSPHRRVCLSMMDDKSDAEPADDFADFGEDLDTTGVVLEDLNWRVEKLRLEEQNKRRFLKASPRFLPYDDCRRWVQGWGRRWETSEDWMDWIAMGEKRNSYIPSDPEGYYGKLGQWISWEHFLGTGPSEDEDDADDSARQ